MLDTRADRRGRRAPRAHRLARAGTVPRRVPGGARRAEPRGLRDAAAAGGDRGARGRPALRPRARRRLPRHDDRGRGDPAGPAAPATSWSPRTPTRTSSRSREPPGCRSIGSPRRSRAPTHVELATNHRAPEPVAVEAWVAPARERRARSDRARAAPLARGARRGVARHGRRRAPPRLAPGRPAAGARRRAHPAGDARARALAHGRSRRPVPTCSRCGGSWPTSPRASTLIEQLLVSDVVGLSPAAARGSAAHGAGRAAARSPTRSTRPRGSRPPRPRASWPPARRSPAPRCSPA